MKIKISFSVIRLLFITICFLYVTKHSSVLAASTSWDFSISGDYSLSSSSTIEVANSSARLKVQNYSNDTNTVALYHLDESTGNPADSSSNNNTASANNITYTSGNLNNKAVFDGSSSYISIEDSSTISLSQENTLEAWSQFNTAFSAGSHAQRQGIFDKGTYQLYFDNETGKLTYELADASSINWTQVAGNDINNSWDLDGKPSGHAVTYLNSNVYVGLGNGTGDAEVWRWNGSTWAKIGGDGINSGWASQTFESVLSLTTDGTDIYAGLGTTAGDGEVWKYTVLLGTWDKIGGDGTGWGVNTFQGVYSLYYQNSILYAGLGNGANNAEVWSLSGSTWTKIGGDSANSGWTTNYDVVYSITGDGTNIYAGLGVTTGEAEVWKWNGSIWAKIGGDGTGWADATYESVLSLTYVGSSLYAGLGTGANDAEVWRLTAGTWTKIGGDSENSGWTTNYDGVYSLKNNGTDVYAGLGVSGGEQEIWKWSVSGNSWSKIGGDGENSGFTGTNHTIVESMFVNGSTIYALITSGVAGRSSELWEFNGSVWTQLGGNYVNSSWGYRGLYSVEVLNVAGNYLYAGTGITSAGNALVWRYDDSTWTLIGGQSLNNGWGTDTYERVSSMISHGGQLYVGLGSSANDAEVWNWNGSVWAKIGGDGDNSGWTSNYDEVTSLSSFNGKLYAGLGISNGESEVWEWNGSAWAQIGGTASGNWGTSIPNTVTSMAVYNGRLYAGLGSGAGEAEVWQYSGSSTNWTKVGGDDTNSSWDAVNFENVESMIVYNNELIAGLGASTGDAEVWSYNGSTWTKIGGDEENESWTTGTYERVRTIAVYNGDLYAGIGNGAGEGEVWRYRGGSWTQIGGDTNFQSWTNVVEEVGSFSPYKGKLYAGIGNSQNVDAAIWSYGNNSFLQSTTNSFDTNWRHIAATYDGATMKIYIDGTLDNTLSSSVSMSDTSHNLLIGATYAGREQGKVPGFFQGSLDELRISNSARTSFTTSPFSSSAQTVQPNTSVHTSQIKNWDDFIVSESLNGGTITYRLSIDNATTWKYWNGSQWTTSSSTSQSNTATDIDTNIATLTAGSGGILWQAILDGSGTQQVALSSVQLNGTSDSTDPVNPDTLTAASSNGGSAITTNTWYPNTAPYFTWSGATDTGGSGIAGYYVYFDGTSDADPVTNGSFQTTAIYTGSGLSSGSTYYLRIKTKDNAGNISDTAWSAFTYKFDSTAPTNPSTITVSPAGYASTNSYTFSWPKGSDSGSDLAGYQYKTGASTGDYSDWSDTISDTSVTLADAAYQTDANLFYLRTIDTAGNVQGTPVSVSFYYAGSGPSTPQFLSVNRSSNTSNSFAFSWSAPASYSGSVSDLTYCYTVNTLPSASTCTFTSAGATSLSAGPFATQTGLNTFYVAAKNADASGGAINYGAYASVAFTANTSAPGLPLNMDISDASIKSSSAWKLTTSWSAPSDTGSGIENYQLYRSTDDSTYTKIATTTGSAYVDTGLSQITYYYKVRACDSVNNCGEFSTAVSMEPTGKYTSAAGLASGPAVTAITTKKATISWSTDRESDSKVSYGTAAGSYLSEEPSNSSQVTDHIINLTNLSPGTTYYFKSKWTDEDGNTGASTEKSFTTEPSPTVKDVLAKTISISSAIIDFTTNGATSVKIYYGETTAFGGVKTISTATSESKYTAELDDLKDGTKYYYKINTLDTESNEYEGTILNFSTLPRPKITGIKIQQVVGSAQPAVLISWESNTPTSSVATFFPEGKTGEARDEVDINLREGEHQILLKGLVPETSYIVIVSGRDKIGNEAKAEPQKFTTATDTRPPKITGLKIEGSIAKSTSDSSKSLAQLIVTWTTDEPSTSQVEFGEGSGSTYSQKTQQDSNMTLNHLVVISNLSPSKVYHLRALSKDKINNEGKSVDSVTITQKATDQALNLVITNLLEVFGLSGNK